MDCIHCAYIVLYFTFHTFLLSGISELKFDLKSVAKYFDSILKTEGGRLPGSRTVYQGFGAVFPVGLPRFGAMGFPRVWSECTGDSSVLNCFFFIRSSKPLQIQGTLLPTLGRLFQTPGVPFPWLLILSTNI